MHVMVQPASDYMLRTHGLARDLACSVRLVLNNTMTCKPFAFLARLQIGKSYASTADMVSRPYRFAVRSVQDHAQTPSHSLQGYKQGGAMLALLT